MTKFPEFKTTVERLMTDYTPNRADWLRAIWGRQIWNSLGPSAFSASRRPVFWRLSQRRHAEVAEIAQRRTELRALLQFPRFTNVIRQSIVRRPPSTNESFRNGSYLGPGGAAAALRLIKYRDCDARWKP